MNIDAGLTISDADSTNLNGASVTITNGLLSGPDTLTFTPHGGISGSFDATADVLTFTGTGSVADYEKILRSVKFRNVSDMPFASLRTLVFQVSDGTNSSSDSRDVQVIAVNDRPTISVANGKLSYNEMSPALVIDVGLTVSDVDNFQLSGATIWISANFRATEDELRFTPSGPITGTYNTATGILTLAGNGTPAEYQAVLRTVAYYNSGNSPTTLTRTVTYEINDGALTASDARDVRIVALNDAPSMNPGAFTLAENSAGGTAVGTATASDPDVGDLLSFVITSGNISGGFAINTVTGQITVANSAALDFEATPTFSLTVEVIDQSGLRDTDTITVSLTNINESPSITSNGGGASATLSLIEGLSLIHI